MHKQPNTQILKQSFQELYPDTSLDILNDFIAELDQKKL